MRGPWPGLFNWITQQGVRGIKKPALGGLLGQAMGSEVEAHPHKGRAFKHDVAAYIGPIIAPEPLVGAIILAAGVRGGGVKLAADKLAAGNVAQWHLLYCFNFHIGSTPG